MNSAGIKNPTSKCLQYSMPNATAWSPLTAVRHTAAASAAPAGASSAGCWHLAAAQYSKLRVLVALFKLHPTATVSRSPADWMMILACWRDAMQACTSSCSEQSGFRLRHQQEKRQQGNGCCSLLGMRSGQNTDAEEGKWHVHAHQQAVQPGVPHQQCPHLPKAVNPIALCEVGQPDRGLMNCLHKANLMSHLPAI